MGGEQILVYRPEEVAKLLNIGRSSIYRLLQSGQLKSKRIGKLYRIPSAYVDEYLSTGCEDGSFSGRFEKGGRQNDRQSAEKG